MVLKNVLLAGAATVAFAGAAAADTPAGFYMDFQAGANWVQDFDTLDDIDSVFDYEFDTGYAVMGSAGYKLESIPFRIEYEAGWRSNDFDFGFDIIDGGEGGESAASAVSGDLVGDGTVNVFSNMLNVLYDVDLGPGYVLSLGGGIGGARVAFEGGVGSVNDNVIDDRDWVFAYQATAELEMMAGDNLGVYIGYDYFQTDKFDLDVAPGLVLTEFRDEYSAHTVFAGLRYHFGEAEAAPPPPPPPPPPPAAAKTFIVFFNFDRSDLTPEAQAVVAEAAAAYKAGASVTMSVQVRGHTDTVGSAAYNLPLSERRAASVKDGLVANGVPDNVITTSGAGFSEPLVPTGPGVKEPQNRRATIDLTGAGS